MKNITDIYNFVEKNKDAVCDLLYESKVRKMIKLLKESGFNDFLKSLSKEDYHNMLDVIRQILSVPTLDVQDDIFELSMMVDILLLKISNADKDISGYDAFSLLNTFGNSYNNVKLYLEHIFNMKL